MKRGTRVGQAYVAITADGSGVNKDIADSFEDVDYESIGRDGAGRYTKGWAKVREDIAAHLSGIDKDFAEKFDRLPQAIANSRAISQGLDKSVASAFDSGRLDSLIREVGKRAGIQYGKGFDKELDRTVLDSIRRTLEDSVKRGGSVDLSALFDNQKGLNGGGFATLGPLIDKITREVERDMEAFWDGQRRGSEENARITAQMLASRAKMHAASNAAIEKSDEALARAREKSDDALLKSQQKMLDSVLRGEKAKADFVGKFEAARAKAHADSNDAIEKDDAALVKAQQRIFDAARKRAIKDDAALWKVRRATAKSYSKYLADLDKGRINEFGEAVSRNQQSWFSKIDVGKMLGKGSRNNFLNFIGSLVGGISNILTGGVKMVGGFVSTFRKGMADAASEGAGFFAKMGGGFSALGSSIAASAASWPVAVAALVFITGAASLLATVMSALLGIVVALASTIVSALVGAATVGAGALLAVVAAGGLLTAAFMSMTNAQKDLLSNAFRPLKAEMVGIGQIIIQEMVPHFKVWSQNLQQALLLLAPLAQVMGGAFGNAGDILTKAFSGPGFKAMTEALRQNLPDIVNNLSRAFGRFLNGAMGLFAAIMPMVNRFSRYLADVMGRFSNWANSAKGQNAIVDFVERAVDSLQSLWGFTREVFGLIGDLLFNPVSQNAGDNMFDSMADAVQRMRKAIAKAIENGDLQRWFDKAAEFGSALWEVAKALYKIFVALENSGVLAALTGGMKLFAGAINGLALGVPAAISVLEDFAGVLGNLIGLSRDYVSAVGSVTAAAGTLVPSGPLVNGTMIGTGTGLGQGGTGSATGMGGGSYSVPDLIDLGTTALNNTYESSGGYKPDPKYNNPYVKWAQQFIDSGPTIAQQIRRAVREVTKMFNQSLREASKAVGSGEARSIISASIENAKAVGQSLVDSARSALSSAASSLASASNPKDAARALAQVKRMQEGLKNALKAQDRIQKAMARLDKQKVVTDRFVDRLLAGDTVKRATLADYAEARQRLAEKIEKANQKLADAIAMRKEYKNAVVEAVKAFGSLMTAQASTVNGVEQALTAADITSNLRDRLAKIREFQSNLQKLLAMGLRNDAYKQLLDAGVEEGGEFAAALVAGGQGAVAEVNSLTGQINSVAESLGIEAANRLYQSGVQAAQGIVDGLEAQSDKLERWAEWLGKHVAWSLKNALNGIKVNENKNDDGGRKGGDKKGGSDASAGVGTGLSSKVAVSPEVAAYAASKGESPTVSGNQPKFRDLVVHTPTENPKAVAQEVLNEVTGRL